MSSFESHLNAPAKAHESTTDTSHLLTHQGDQQSAAHSDKGAGRDTAAAHLPPVNIGEANAHAPGLLTKMTTTVSEMLQGAKGEVHNHPRGWQHSGELGLAAGAVTGLAAGAAIAAGVIAAPEIAAVGGAALALGAGASLLEGMHEAKGAYTKGKDANATKHAGAVAVDAGAFAVGGIVGTATGLYSGVATVEEMAMNCWASGKA